MHVCVLECVAPPMVVGAWSMAEALWQLFEFYMTGMQTDIHVYTCTCMYMYMYVCTCVYVHEELLFLSFLSVLCSVIVHVYADSGNNHLTIFVLAHAYMYMYMYVGAKIWCSPIFYAVCCTCVGCAISG